MDPNFTKVNLSSGITKKKSFGFLLRLLLIVVTIGFSAFFVNRYIFQSKADVDVATTSFTPKTNIVTQNEAFTQTVSISAGEKKISAVDFTISYNPEYFEYVPVEDSTVFLSSTIPVQNYFTSLVMQKVSDDKDSVRIVLIANKQDSELVQNIMIPLRFRGLKVSEESQYLAFNEPASQIVGTTGADDHRFDIDSTDASSTIAIAPSISCVNDGQCGENASCASNGYCICNSSKYNCDEDWTNGCESTTSCEATHSASLNLKLKLQGVSESTKITPLQKFKITLGNSEKNKHQKTVDLKLADDYTFTGEVGFDDIAIGDNFRLLIKGPKHMQKRFCTLTPKGEDYSCKKDEGFTLVAGKNEADLSAVPLLSGDLPEQDGLLDAEDVGSLLKCIAKPNKECIKITDLNYDGVTLGNDLSLMFATMATTYEDDN